MPANYYEIRAVRARLFCEYYCTSLSAVATHSYSSICELFMAISSYVIGEKNILVAIIIIMEPIAAHWPLKVNSMFHVDCVRDAKEKIVTDKRQTSICTVCSALCAAISLPYWNIKWIYHCGTVVPHWQ